MEPFRLGLEAPQHGHRPGASRVGEALDTSSHAPVASACRRSTPSGGWWSTPSTAGPPRRGREFAIHLTGV